MDEAEKYQQRVQAIAEKRRLQEEQERVKREMEEERIRLQQLKRKSLRDQWLMEGPPTSPDSSGPRSPLWGAQAQEIEHNIDSLQAETERLTEEAAKLTEDGVSVAPVNDGLTLSNSEGLHILEDGRTEPSVKETVLQNGQGNGTMDVGAEEDLATAVSSVTADEKGPNGEVATNMPALESAAMQTSADNQSETQMAVEETVTMATSPTLSVSAEEAVPTSNGLAAKPDDEPGDGGAGGAVTLRFLGLSDAGQGVGLDLDDDGGAIMRAERVIITDEEGEEEAAAESQAEASEAPSAETPSATENQEPEAAGAEAEAQTSAQAPTKPEKDTEAEVTELGEQKELLDSAEQKAEVAELTEQKAEVTELTEQKVVEAAVEEEKKVGEQDGETPAEAQAAVAVPETAEATAAAEVQPQLELTDGAVVTSDVPVYSPTVQPTPTASASAESQPPETSAAKKEEGAEAPAVVPAPATASGPEIVPSSPSQFQDVPLDESANAVPKPPRLERPAEQEPLLVYKAAAPTDTSPPRRADGGDAPKQKSCECCSIM